MCTDSFPDTYATYCPEDDKIRLYCGRVPRDDYMSLRKAGFQSTPKQDCDFSAVWTPNRETLALSLVECPTIQDEDTDPAERAVERAERFGDYRDKRLGEAEAGADRFDDGPRVHGYQSQDKAERAAARHDRVRQGAVSCFDKAEYWSRRGEGVLEHASHLARPDVRRSRIRKLEAHQRKLEKEHKGRVEQRAHLRGQLLALLKDFSLESGPAFKLTSCAWALVDLFADRHCSTEARGHWRFGEDSTQRDALRFAALFNILDNSSMFGSRPYHPLLVKILESRTIARASVVELLQAHPEIDPEAYQGGAWYQHNEKRLAYERAALGDDGGSAREAPWRPGDWISRTPHRFLSRFVEQVVSVTRSQADGLPVSVVTTSGRRVQLERLPASRRREPTAAELEAFHQQQAEVKAAKKEAAKAAPAKSKLINPTDEDAQRLQTALLERYGAGWERRYGRDKLPSGPLRMTQAQYSAQSGGPYDRFQTVELAGGCRSNAGYVGSGFPTVVKVRAWSNVTLQVVILTDKPQKPLPAALWHDPLPGLRERIASDPERLQRLASRDWLSHLEPEDFEFWKEAKRAGLAYQRSMSQFGLTEEGCTLVHAHLQGQQA